ncbi:hypothetical protein N7456_004519 [Penicillium angulare]|uniref:Uncharacterized protein n=1 Tax=Penicillium angulare TaxID=116970 RepID=A0A9W9FWR0_9EURO|nr:hypothetical protein N7456_004519 [Penicillium angulare]
MTSVSQSIFDEKKGYLFESIPSKRSLEGDSEDDKGTSVHPDPWNGSPWDMTQWRVVDVDKLDLDNSYAKEGDYKAEKETKQDQSKTQSRARASWSRKGQTALTDCDLIRKLPGWTTEEPDLDPNDFEAQIQRAQERIDENVMPHAFEWKLKYYQTMKENHEKTLNKWPANLDPDVLSRLDILEGIGKDLQEHDKYEQLPNIRAIMEAYKERRLHFNGLVTYWSEGQQVSQPRPFDWDEFVAIKAHFSGQKGFWVEGYEGARPSLRAARRVLLPHVANENYHFYNICIRIAGNPFWTQLPFLLDTGATHMDIYHGDVPLLLGPERQAMHFTGMRSVDTGSGQRQNVGVMHIQVCLLSDKQKRMTPWTNVFANVLPGDPTASPNLIRSDGPVFRDLLFHSYVPDGSKRVFIANKKRKLKLPTALAQAERQHELAIPE